MKKSIGTGYRKKPYSVFEVIKPLDVQSGRITLVAGFTFNNEFNALSDTGILCAYEFIRYNPFHDAPEEQVIDMDFLCEMVLNLDIAMSVVASIAILAGYAASLFFTAGATAVYAPYVVGGLSFVLGSTAVCGVAMNDCRRGEVSSIGSYVITGGIKAVEGAVAGAAICMAPGYAAGKISAMFPGGVSILNLIIPAEKLVKIAMAGTLTVSSVNAIAKVNDEVSVVRGENVVRDTIGDKKYDIVKGATAFLSDLMFWDSIFHPEYFNGNNAGGIQQDVIADSGEGGSGTVNGFDTTVNAGKQGKHIVGNNNFIEGRSVFNGTVDDAQRLVDNFAGTGEWIGTNKERVNFGGVIGQYVNPATNEAVDTIVGIIHYSKTGTHIVPAQPIQ